ncbi:MULTISPECIES: hypothetical protein [unclassified Neisseria]|uniref:hypothetical protein n=1 Tax=unclassified Neisseria TaxID=2623750 RepID=UPI002666DB74|nr:MULTISPECIES: hypothetical protein [unclassified Neisseria]MDO1509389.1 hypothetical protein [Neisseria sp. MVDL19-042950]MDO1515332.1 hypothetical protein [Neisseria sp. MVDL18-041461]MDO1562692.1 hypothetical protein [Neisseria sp. MVDL20-010259]
MISILFVILILTLVSGIWFFLLRLIHKIGIYNFWKKSLIIIVIFLMQLYIFNQYFIYKEKKMFPTVITLKKGGDGETIITGSNAPLSIPFLHYCRRINVNIDSNFENKWNNEKTIIINKLKKYSDYFEYKDPNRIFFTKEFTPNLSPFFGYDEVFSFYEININDKKGTMIYCNYDDFREIPEEWL